MFVPYRAKNSPEKVPYVTLSLIVVNSLIFLMTTTLAPGGNDPDNPFLQITKQASDTFAISWVTMMKEPWRLLTSLFMHADPMHLLGNMLVLWVFGAIVEGRLGHARYLGLYLASGIVSGFFQTTVVSVLDPEGTCIGASGAIMGVAGACLWLFPFANIAIAYIGVPTFLLQLLRPDRTERKRYGYGFISVGYTEWSARWIVLYLFGLDLWNGFAIGGNDGVGHFAHMSGLMAGLGLATLSKARRDGRRISDAQDMRASGVNLDALSISELAHLLHVHPTDEALVRAYCLKILDSDSANWEILFADALQKYGPIISEKVDAKVVASSAVAVSAEKTKLPVAPLLRIAARLEKAGMPDDLRLAAQLLRNLFKQEKTGADAETALMRYAQVTERMVTEKISDNPNEPIVLYQTLLRRFPQSPHIFAAHSALERLGVSAPAPVGLMGGLTGDLPARPGGIKPLDDLQPLR